ncbi:similar to FAD binding domain containing protein [Plenodomus lingam JN3]|uniref:Similar to FAD binding domain containing protein n=1 Tax=Leptosphaeria maculans (strain JN3 / isolate v23.1.3 / race Av1-4-5-6-7-8) TaxID=985895 RepID=E4ZH21_LEPMJ|nr:similar to FAD binding domain containing protein [Plenodomus lingam JN3]CBX90591.1 similar to FAD binding domain containing protein [Plenodomus lingam JN3]
MPFLRRLICLLLCSCSVTASSSDASQACAALISYLPGKLSFPGNQQYEDSISSYAYIGTRLRPTCVAHPENTKEVAAIVKILSQSNSVEFAIRSGGHNTNRGFADIKEGITIDLSLMNTVELRHSENIVTVGPGTRWQSVYDALDLYSLTVQGGRNGLVGVGGFLTGGFFSPERGWACDSVINFEVVLSTGAIVDANATSHPDLFTSLKGGQNNFGVVTRFDLRTFSQGKMWGGIVIYTDASDKQLLDTLTAFKEPGKFDPYAMFTFGFVYDAALRTFTSDIAMYHSRPESVNGSTLEVFAKIEPQIFNSIRTDTPGGFASERLSPIFKSYYMHWSTTTFAISPTILFRIHTLFRNVSLALTDEYASANLTIACSIQSVPAAATKENPNSLGFDPLSKPEQGLINIGLAFQYDDPTVTEALQQALQILTTAVDRIAISEGVADPHVYMNYAGSWQNVLAGYGNESLVRLKNVAEQYDKNGIFQKQVKGGFKLGTM